MAIDRTVAPLPKQDDGVPIAVDPSPSELEGDVLTRLLELNAEHTRLQMLYEDLYARYSRQKEQLAQAREVIEELDQAVEKRDSRIRVLRMTIRRLKGSASGSAGRQQFPEAGA